MKLKDIEKSLKNEQKQMGVPDVLARSKKAPINRLLDGQTPLRAFNKPLASRLLWCAMILLVTTILCFAVFMLLPRKSQGVNYGYMSVTIESGSDIDRYGIVADDDLQVAIVVHETLNGEKNYWVVNIDSNSLENAINELYVAKSIDKVRVCAYYSSNKSAQSAIDIAQNAFDELYEVEDAEDILTTSFGSEEDKAIWVESIGEAASADMSVKELAVAYLDKFLQA